MTFDRIVEASGFSRSEVASHIRILKKGDMIVRKEDGTYVHQLTQRDLVESLNQMMFGCPDPIHVFGIGHIDPRSRYARRFLD